MSRKAFLSPWDSLEMGMGTYDLLSCEVTSIGGPQVHKSQFGHLQALGSGSPAASGSLSLQSLSNKVTLLCLKKCASMKFYHFHKAQALLVWEARTQTDGG